MTRPFYSTVETMRIALSGVLHIGIGL